MEANEVLQRFKKITSGTNNTNTSDSSVSVLTLELIQRRKQEEQMKKYKVRKRNRVVTNYNVEYVKPYKEAREAGMEI